MIKTILLDDTTIEKWVKYFKDYKFSKYGDRVKRIAMILASSQAKQHHETVQVTISHRNAARRILAAMTE